ncbi:MAG: hypothetical protein ACREKM_07770 [Longimicrobiales bacterium]
MKYMMAGTLLAVASVLLGGCEDGTGPESAAPVAVAFSVASAGQAALSGGWLGSRAGLVVTGTNGTLEIEDLRLIVSDFELEGEDDADCDEFPDDDVRDSDDCEDFEFPPFLVDVPLTGGIVEVASDMVRPGVYKELEFETRGLDDDDDDDEQDRARILELIAELRATYPSFPERASMVASGVFTATGSEPRPFVVFFDAEVEIELELEPPVVLPGDGLTQLTVDLRPDMWFMDGDGVRDLSQFDNRFVEFEFEMERGFTEVEIDD